MPIKMVNHHRQPYLKKLHERGKTHRALQTALLLESIVPWDLSLAEGVLDPEQRAISAAQLLNLQKSFGDEGLARVTQIFAASDVDRDGRLNAREIFAAASALRADLQEHEAAMPPGVAESDAQTRQAAQCYRELCDERLHEFSLLRLLCPPPRQGAPGVRAHSRPRDGSNYNGVMQIAASAAARAKGGGAAKREAAAQAVADALSGEHARVEAVVDETGGVRLRSFLEIVSTLVAEIGAAQEGVASLAQAHAACVAQAAARHAAEEAEMRRKAHEKDVERMRIEAIKAEASSNELDRLLSRVPLEQHIAERTSDDESPSGHAPSEAAAGVAAAVDSRGATRELPSPAAAAPSPGAKADGSPSSGLASSSSPPLPRERGLVLTVQSEWRPVVELKFFEEARRRRTADVAACFERLPD